MKKIKLISLMILTVLMCKSQTWAWARNTTGSSTGVVTSVCSDGSGNIFEAGYFIGPSISFGNYMITKQGNPASGSGCYLAKYDAAGTVQWAIGFGGFSSDMIRSACTDALGNIFVTGTLGGSMVTIGTVTLTGNGGNGIFLAKFNPNGNTLWANRYLGNNVDEGTGVCLDSQGNACISAYFSSQTVVIGTTTLNSNSANNALIAKFDANGNFIWVKQPSGTAMGAAAYAIACDAADNLYLVGDFKSPSLSFGVNTVTRTGNQNAFLAKYDGNGNVLWAKSSTGSNFEYLRSVSVDAAGNAYVLGHYTSSVVTLGSYSLSNVAQEDVMIAKYNANGSALWATSASGNGRDIGHCVYVSGNRVFLTGSLGSFAYAPGAAVTIGNTPINPPTGYTDPMFFAQLDLNGNVQYATGLASGGYNNSSVCMDRACHAYLGSNYANLGTFSMTIGSNTLTYSAFENIFLARMDFLCPTDGLADMGEVGAGTALYPNPNSGNFTVDIPTVAGKFDLEIYDAIGQIVYRQSLEGSSSEVHTGRLAEGVYYFKLLKNNVTVKNGRLILK